MNSLSSADREFEQRFSAGLLSPSEFNHRAHLRLAYIHLASQGPDAAVSTFRESLLRFLSHHQIDPGKFHETLTQAWLQAVWHFMLRHADTASSEEFLEKSEVLHDAKVMLTHYSSGVLSSDKARRQFVAPDLDPIPRGAADGASSVSQACQPANGAVN
jgi:hypothetical protein